MNRINSLSLIFPKMTFPYSSSWLVFINILKWNYIGDLISLRKILNPNKSIRRKGNLWWCGGELPHWKIEAAAGLSLNDLRYSYMDGWFPPPTSSECAPIYTRPKVAIRHCPQCIKFGYHSVVFYFEHITCCPWHKEELQTCEKCTSALDLVFSANKGIYGVSGQCEHLDIALGVLPSSPATEQFNEQVQVWCSGLRDWVQRSTDLVGHAVYEVIATKNNSTSNKQMAIDFLTDRIGNPVFSSKLGEKISIFKFPRSKLAWKLPFWGILHRARIKCLNQSQPQIDATTMKLIAKAIRRYVFRRFLRSHRRCLSRLVMTKSGDWYELNIAAVCPCVMAYLIVFSKDWGVSPWTFLHPYKKDVNCKSDEFKSRPRTTILCEFELYMYYLLASFYRVWGALRHYKSMNCKQLVVSSRYDNAAFNLVHIGSHESALEYRYSCYWDSYLFMENPQYSLEASIPDCLRRRKQSLTVHVDEFLSSALLNNENVLCAMHDRFASGECSCEL